MLVTAPPETLRERDPKGLYVKADAGRLPQFTGTTAPYEYPEAAELTKQMLDYAGQGATKLQTVDLPQLVREMSKLLSALIPKQVELHHHFQEGLPSIEGDATQLRQVVMNLITNAAESIVDTRGRVVITIERVDVTEQQLDQYISHASGAGSYLKLAVTDDGTGMNEETLRRVFDPFFTTKFKGRGLGMAAVLGIMGLNDYLLLIVKPLLTGYVVGYLSIWFGSRIEHGPHGIRRALPAAFATSLMATIAIGALITALL